MSETNATARPTDVVILAVLVFLFAAYEVYQGIVALTTDPGGAGSAGRGFLVTLGIIAFVFALIEVVIGIGILRGNRAARTALVVVIAFNVILAIVGMFVEPQTVWGQLITVVLGVAIIILMYTGNVGRWFASGGTRGR